MVDPKPSTQCGLGPPLQLGPRRPTASLVGHRGIAGPLRPSAKPMPHQTPMSMLPKTNSGRGHAGAATSTCLSQRGHPWGTAIARQSPKSQGGHPEGATHAAHTTGEKNQSWQRGHAAAASPDRRVVTWASQGSHKSPTPSKKPRSRREGIPEGAATLCQRLRVGIPSEPARMATGLATCSSSSLFVFCRHFCHKSSRTPAFFHSVPLRRVCGFLPRAARTLRTACNQDLYRVTFAMAGQLMNICVTRAATFSTLFHHGPRDFNTHAARKQQSPSSHTANVHVCCLVRHSP